MKIEFFISPCRGGYQLQDETGNPHTDAVFESKTVAADMAVRFAQDNDALYAIFY